MIHPRSRPAGGHRRDAAGLPGLLRAAVLGLALCGLGGAVGAPAQLLPAGPAAALHAKRLALQPQLRTNPFGEPLVLSSRELPDRLEGDVYAEVAHPFAAVAPALRTSAGMCEVLFLHLNVRSCKPSPGADGDGVLLLVGPKRAGALDTAYRIRYAMRVEVADATQLRVTLGAETGPLATWDYRMLFEAVPIDDGRSFVHFGYAYGYGMLARMAMGAYLATAGRAKIGFTIEGRDADGRPRYVRGERAALERNVMRYYLALLAHRSVTTGAPEAQMQARLRAWFALTERHAAQLHEYGLADYLQEKRDDLARGALGN